LLCHLIARDTVQFAITGDRLPNAVERTLSLQNSVICLLDPVDRGLLDEPQLFSVDIPGQFCLFNLKAQAVLLREGLKNEPCKHRRRSPREADGKERTDTRKDSRRQAGRKDTRRRQTAEVDRLWFYELLCRQSEHIHRRPPMGAGCSKYV